MTVVAALAGMVFNAAGPGGIPFVGDWSPRVVTELHAGDLEVISVDDAYRSFSTGGAVFLDARDPGAFAAGHVPGSLNVSPEQAPERLGELRSLIARGRGVIAYCYDVNCPQAAELARKLRELGAGPVKVMPEGWTGWMDRGLPYD
jgi:rhodanese-related sulfurtransferase